MSATAEVILTNIRCPSCKMSVSRKKSDIVKMNGIETVKCDCGTTIEIGLRQEKPQSAPLLQSYLSAEQIAETAAMLVSGDRQTTHGDKLENHENIASLWTPYLKRKHGAEFSVSALDVANMMELLKVARRIVGAFNIDDYIDGAGYAAVAGEIAGRTEK